MLRISSICKKNNIKIIEDAAHSLGATQYKKLIGNCEFSEITVFSLHPAKIITSAEGGLATSQEFENNRENEKTLFSWDCKVYGSRRALEI